MWFFEKGIKCPTLIINREKCFRSLEALITKAKKHGVFFRPHFKTHQSISIGRWFRSRGISAITVSSVKMARYFASDGWNDITIAFPLNLREIDEINQLASTIQLNLLVDNPLSVSILARQLKHRVGVFIDVDAGHHRTGIEVNCRDEILKLSEIISGYDKLTLKGLIVHNGHTYNQSSPEEILRVHDQSLAKLIGLKTFLENKGFSIQLSIGDTPSATLTENLSGVDEFRPGNFIFYDLMQQQLGVCSYEQIAVVVACPVVATYPQRHEVVVYGGAVHLSRESLRDEFNGMIYGKVVMFIKDSWSAPLEKTFVKSLFQEHGIIQTTANQINLFSPGKVIGILPVHSCLTVNQFSRLYTIEGEQLATMKCFETE